MNGGVEHKCLSSICSLFQVRVAATEKALCPNLRLVRGAMKSARLDDRAEGLPGTAAAHYDDVAGHATSVDGRGEVRVMKKTPGSYAPNLSATHRYCVTRAKNVVLVK